MALTSTLTEMAPQVSARLQDPNNVQWNLDYEIFAGLAEGISELLLIIGRPTQIVNQPLFLQPNTVWQLMPPGFLCLTDISTYLTRLRKTSLQRLDNLCASWTSSWESERGPMPLRWAPLGLNYFIVYPAPLQPMQVNITGIAYPFTDTWPPTGAESSPFHKEVNQALEMYAAYYARVKEIGQDFQEGLSLYQGFLQIAQRLSQIEDRRDSLMWTRAIGAPTSPSQVAHR